MEPVCCSMSSSNCCFLTCIQVSQEAGQVVWYAHLFQNLFKQELILVQFSSVAQSHPTFCNPMDCSTPGLPVHRQLPEFTQTHVHWAEYIMRNAGLDEAQAGIKIVRRNFELWCWRRLLNLLNGKEIQRVNPKGNQSWIFIRRTNAEAQTPILWPPDVKNWLIEKDPHAGEDWRWEEKGTTEDEMVGWNHQLNGHEFE